MPASAATRDDATSVKFAGDCPKADMTLSPDIGQDISQVFGEPIGIPGDGLSQGSTALASPSQGRGTVGVSKFDTAFPGNREGFLRPS